MMTMAENTLMYGIVAIVAVLVFVGAVFAVNMLGSPSYDVSIGLNSNSTGAIYPYQATAFNIVVTNGGSREVVGLPVAFYVNGQQRNYSTYAVPAHQSITVPEVYTYLNSGGYLFTAVADPGNVIKITNRSSASKSVGLTAMPSEQANVYGSIPNANMVYTDSFTTSGTGLLSGSLMAKLYNISSLLGINGEDGGILAKTYQDLYPYVSVANGAFSTYSNGSSSYVSWIQGTVNPSEVGLIIASFGKRVVEVPTAIGTVDYAAVGNEISACSYYQGGWTKIIEYYNASRAGTCLGIAGSNYTPTEGNILVSALKSTRIGTILTANQINATKQIQWSHFYYNNATILGQMVEYSTNVVAASTLTQLSSPQSVFLSRITKIPANIVRINSTCLGLTADVNGSSVCSTVLPTATTYGNTSYGAVYTRYISSNYTVELYSLIGSSDLVFAHDNAAELISRLGINGSSVKWVSPFKDQCGFSSGFGCNFTVNKSSGYAVITITNRNYTSVSLNNITCSLGGGFPATGLNGTVGLGQNITISAPCQSIAIPGFSASTDYDLNLGYTYRGVKRLVNGTLNVSNFGG
jgi:hypothetical protein